MADGTTLGTAYVQVIPSTEGISGQLSSAFTSAGDSAGASAGTKAGSSFSSALGTAAKVGVTAVAAVGTGVAALSKTFIDSASSVAAYGDDIDKMSQKIGISAEAYQEWDTVLQHSGSSMSAMKPAMKNLFTAAQNGSEAFEKLGISQEKAASMSKEDLWAATIKGLQNVEDENERAALAQELLGKSSMELGALLNTSAEDTQAMRDRVHELGGVMSDEAVKAAAAYQDSLQDMTTAMDGIKRNITASFLPSITGIMDGITDILAGDTEKGMTQISDGVSQMIEQINTMMPRVIEIVQSIMSGLGQAIIDNLPIILESGTQIALQLLEGIIQALPELLTAGLSAITTLATGITDALPELIPTMVEVVLSMVEGLIDNIDQLVDAGIQLITALAEGLIEAIPVILEKVPEIIEKLITALTNNMPKIADAGVKLLTALVEKLPDIIAQIVKSVPKIVDSIVKAFVNLVPKMVEAGVNLIKGVGKGLIQGAADVIKSAKEVANNVVGAVKDFFQISSPSKIMIGFGRFLDEGLAQGIFEYAKKPVTQIAKLSQDLADEFAPQLTLNDLNGQFSFGKLRDAGSYFNQDTYRNAQRDLTVILEMDRQVFGKLVYKLNNEETQRVGVNLAGGFSR